MQNKTIILTFIIFAISCSTTPDRIYYPSITVELPASQSDIAWSRAHAFLCKNLYKPPISSDVVVLPEPPASGKYVITAGQYQVTREFTGNTVVIRIITRFCVKYSTLPGQTKKYTTHKTRKTIGDTHEFMTDFIKYVKTGTSDLMFDNPFPPDELE